MFAGKDGGTKNEKKSQGPGMQFSKGHRLGPFNETLIAKGQPCRPSSDLRGGATRIPINVRMCTNLHYIEGYKERFDELECS